MIPTRGRRRRRRRRPLVGARPKAALHFLSWSGVEDEVVEADVAESEFEVELVVAGVGAEVAKVEAEAADVITPRRAVAKVAMELLWEGRC